MFSFSQKIWVLLLHFLPDNFKKSKYFYVSTVIADMLQDT
jgi:hypothetical protein